MFLGKPHFLETFFSLNENERETLNRNPYF